MKVIRKNSAAFRRRGVAQNRQLKLPRRRKFAVITLSVKSFPLLNASSPRKKEKLSPNEYPDIQSTDKKYLP